MDDEGFNIMIMEGFLLEMGITPIDKAYNGKEAVEKVVQNYKKTCKDHIPLKYVFTDFNMPIMNGLELGLAIKELQKNS